MNYTTSSHSKAITDNYFKVIYQRRIDHVAFFNSSDAAGTKEAFNRCQSRVNHLGTHSRMVVCEKIQRAGPWTGLLLIGECLDAPAPIREEITSVSAATATANFKKAFDKKKNGGK